MVSGLSLLMVLLFFTCWFHNMVNLPSWLVLLISVHAHTSDHCMILPLFPCICWSAVQCTHYHVSLCTVLLPILGMLIWYGLLSHQIIDICHLFLFVIFLSHNILFAVPDPVLPLFHFQFLLSGLPLTATLTHLLCPTNKLSIYTSNILATQYFAFPSLLRTVLILLLCVECLSFCVTVLIWLV